MTDQAKETMFNLLERWGFPTLVAIAVGWVLRHDVLLPLVEEHRTFVRSLSELEPEVTVAGSHCEVALFHESTWPDVGAVVATVLPRRRSTVVAAEPSLLVTSPVSAGSFVADSVVNAGSAPMLAGVCVWVVSDLPANAALRPVTSDMAWVCTAGAAPIAAALSPVTCEVEMAIGTDAAAVTSPLPFTVT